MKAKIMIAVTAAVVAAFTVCLFMFQDTTVFLNNTYVNGVDVSGMSTKEAQQELTDEWNGHTFEFDFNGEKDHIALEDVGLEYNIGNTLYDMKARPNFLSRVKGFLHIKNEQEIDMVSDGSDKFLELISKFDVCDNTDRTKTKDAYVDLSTTDFNIVPEEIGTEVDPYRIEIKALNAIKGGNFKKEIDLKDVVRQPQITSDSDEIQKQLDYAKKNLTFKIEYDLDGEMKTLTPAEIDSMVKYPEKDVDSQKVKKFVGELADSYNQEGKDYKFKTHSGKTKKIHSYSFGRIMDEEAERDFLTKALQEQKSVTREPECSKKPYKDSDKNDGIGDTYVEISLSEQHLWCFVNGEKELDCDVVTGSIGHETHKGLWVVDWKATDMTLTGTNSNGSKYESFVHYFMPFNYYGEGMHDADGWRSVYGPSVSRYSGSHGCVNMPYKYAKQLYGIVEQGFPVIVY